MSTRKSISLIETIKLSENICNYVRIIFFLLDYQELQSMLSWYILHIRFVPLKHVKDLSRKLCIPEM